MTIQEIYDTYHVPPHLQLHMLRVAGVVQVICEKILDLSPCERDAVLIACLFHDMWNILKFDMTLYPDVREPEGIPYRQGVQEQWKQYGETEHEATMTVAREVWISPSMLEILEPFVLNSAVENTKNAWFLVRFCEYVDGRVWPFGLLSLQERFDDLLERDMRNFTLSEEEVRKKHKECLHALQSIEDEIFAWSEFRPEDVDGEVVESLVEEFRTHRVFTKQDK